MKKSMIFLFVATKEFPFQLVIQKISLEIRHLAMQKYNAEDVKIVKFALLLLNQCYTLLVLKCYTET